MKSSVVCPEPVSFGRTKPSPSRRIRTYSLRLMRLAIAFRSARRWYKRSGKCDCHRRSWHDVWREPTCIPVGALHILALVGTFAPAGRTAERERVPARLPRSAEIILGPNLRGPRPGVNPGIAAHARPDPHCDGGAGAGAANHHVRHRHVAVRTAARDYRRGDSQWFGVPGREAMTTVINEKEVGRETRGQQQMSR